jgi:protein-S-isoprenylcysteine O-methyltransferase Ste14
MPLIPIFKLGIWNAWILILFLILHPFIMKFVDMLVGTGDINRKMGETLAEKREKRLLPIPTLLLFVLFIYSIFLPLKVGTSWFYIGLVFFVFGMAIFLSAIITAAKTPLGQIFSRGIYRYSRHPLYLSFLILFVGISVASASWLFLLLSIGWMVFPISQLASEEQGCLESFGIEYQEYMNRTPKWLGFPKSKR